MYNYSIALLGYYDPEDDGQGIGREGGGQGRGPEAFRRPTGRPGSAG